MTDIAYLIFALFIAGAIVCSVVRIWRGPTVADRINAADVVAISFVGLALGHGWLRGDGLWLDVAMVAGLVLFVGTSGVSLFLDPEYLSKEEDD